ncbi:hypothetical protein RR11_683 [Ruegeria sp. R11]|nr:hypothetical protein RR11_683 [Ruegeria sp. R11]
MPVRQHALCQAAARLSLRCHPILPTLNYQHLARKADTKTPTPERGGRFLAPCEGGVFWSG